MNAKDLEEALEMGMDWSLREGYVWAEDKVCVCVCVLSTRVGARTSVLVLS